MRIALEITGALGGGGYKRYTENILRGLAEEGPEHEYVLFGVFRSGFPERAHALDVPKGRNWRFELRRFPQGLLFPLEEWLGLRYHERFLSALGADIVHGLGSRTPPLDRIPSTLTLHFSGLWPFENPWDRFYFNSMTERGVRQSPKVIAISEFCKKEAVKAWGTRPEKIEVIHYGGPESAFAPGEGAGDSSKPPYFLFVGITRPQKNPKLLVEAFCRMKAKHPELPHRLVFAGGHGEDKPWIEERLKKAGLLGQAEFTGLIPQSEIHRVFQGAFACVCPSLDEGFALTAGEARGCGVPGIGVDAGALPETIADAGLVPAPEPDAVAEAMAKLALDPGLREDLRARGLKRAKDFSWNTAARKTLAVYKDILSGASR
ncbi:MAG: glycosyltransferase family 1 protein [Elusimicrobiota bacterium]